MQIKTKGILFTPIKVAKMKKKSNNVKCWQGYRQLLHANGWSVN